MRYRYSYVKRGVTFNRVFMCELTEERAMELAKEHCNTFGATLLCVEPYKEDPYWMTA